MFLELLVEEPSAENALRSLLPKIVPEVEFVVHTFRGKNDLLRKLPQRLQGYAAWLPEDYQIVVLVDRDGQRCEVLKQRLEDAARSAGLVTKTKAGGRPFQVLNRIAVEELEAWYFGDTEAIRQAYPKVPSSLGKRARYRNPDAIAGGTAEALERELKRYGYHRGGLAKIRAAQDIARHMDPQRNTSPSFRVFCDGLHAMLG